MTLNIMHKLAILSSCGNSFFSSSNGGIADENCDVIYMLREEYKKDDKFKQVVDSNSHLLCDKLKDFLEHPKTNS